MPSSKQATSVAQARLLELKALGLGTHATSAQIIAAIQKKYGSTAPVMDTKTGLPYTPATARAAGSDQAGPKIVGLAILGSTVGGIVDSIGGAVAGGGADVGAAGADTSIGADTGAAGAAATNTATGADAGAAAGATGGSAGAVGAGAGGLFAATGASITSTLDFLKFIAWIFHPRNILRAVEFLIGVVLMIFGFNAAMQGRGERIEGFRTSEGVLTRSGLGRVATALGNSARTRSKPARPRSAPHRTRQRALQQRYSREETLQRKRSSNPRPKKS